MNETKWIDELDRLERKATPKPWDAGENNVMERGGAGDHYCNYHDHIDDDDDDEPRPTEDDCDCDPPRDLTTIAAIWISYYGNECAGISVADARLISALRNHARELIDAKRESEKLRGLLRELEWAGGGMMYECCPRCRGYSPTDSPAELSEHADDCELAEALK